MNKDATCLSRRCLCIRSYAGGAVDKAEWTSADQATDGKMERVVILAPDKVRYLLAAFRLPILNYFELTMDN
jgi:hypothetical protein